MSPSLILRRSLGAAVLGSLFFFQNCAQPPEESTLTGSSLSSSSYTEKLPLAVTAQLDTISYMSCSEIKDTVEKRAYYTFRVGAYSNLTGGLALTSEFRDSTKYYSTTNRARAFADSSVNGDTMFNLSIRSASNYQQPWQTDNDFRVGEEIEAFLPPLDSPEISGALAASQPGQMIQYFPGAQDKRLVEASLRFYKYENNMKNTRDALEGGGVAPGRSVLVAGFSTHADELETGLRSPPSVVASSGQATPVYGKGYLMRFSLPSGVQTGERRVIASSGGIEEIDVSTSPPGQTNAIWDCNPAYQFMVVRPEDRAANPTLCNATVDRFSNTAEQAALAAIRRVLRVEDWFVDLTNHCVMPKRTGDYCYGALSGRTIQYRLASCLNSTTTMCPHYVSVCVRR